MQFSTIKMGVIFFLLKKCQTGGGGPGGVCKKTTFFPVFFVHLSLRATLSSFLYYQKQPFGLFSSSEIHPTWQRRPSLNPGRKAIDHPWACRLSPTCHTGVQRMSNAEVQVSSNDPLTCTVTDAPSPERGTRPAKQNILGYMLWCNALRQNFRHAWKASLLSGQMISNNIGWFYWKRSNSNAHRHRGPDENLDMWTLRALKTRSFEMEVILWDYLYINIQHCSRKCTVHTLVWLEYAGALQASCILRKHVWAASVAPSEALYDIL